MRKYVIRYEGYEGDGWVCDWVENSIEFEAESDLDAVIRAEENLKYLRGSSMLSYSYELHSLELYSENGILIKKLK